MSAAARVRLGAGARSSLGRAISGIGSVSLSTCFPMWVELALSPNPSNGLCPRIGVTVLGPGLYELYVQEN